MSVQKMEVLSDLGVALKERSAQRFPQYVGRIERSDLRRMFCVSTDIIIDPPCRGLPGGNSRSLLR
jgi:hypothetical protein